MARQCAREGGALVRAAYKVGARGPWLQGTRRHRHGDGPRGRGTHPPDHRGRLPGPSDPLRGDAEHHRRPRAGSGSSTPSTARRTSIQGIPFFCVNIALCFDGEPVLGLTYDPLQREEFLAVEGEGRGSTASRCGRRTRASQTRTVVFDFGGSRTARPPLEAFRQLAWEVLHARVLGSAALTLAYAACGRVDLFVFGGRPPWDFAAGIVLDPRGGRSGHGPLRRACQHRETRHPRRLAAGAR